MNRTLFWKVYRRSGDGISPREFAKSIRYPFLISDTEEERKKPDKLKEVLTEEEVKTLKQGLAQTWGYIGYDVEKSAEFGNFKLTNLIAVETCIDADHLKLDGTPDGPAADKIVDRLLDQFDYKPVLLYLCSLIRLV